MDGESEEFLSYNFSLSAGGRDGGPTSPHGPHDYYNNMGVMMIVENSGLQYMLLGALSS